jgi:hypothetical protein
VTGSALLKSTRLELRGLAGPVEIASATVKLSADRVDFTSLAATAAGTHWSGDITIPRACAPAQECVSTFHMQTDELSAERLTAFLNPTRATPWYRILTPEATPGLSWLRHVRASGTISANRLLLANLSANHATASVTLGEAVVHLADLSGDVLGGRHRGTWVLNFTVQPPTYAGSGGFTGISLTQLATAMHDPWISGTGGGKYQVETQAGNAKELFSSATGKLQFSLLNGALSHVVVENEPMKWRRFSGTLALKDSLFSMLDAKLDSGSTTYTVEGTATWNRVLDIKLVSESAGGIAVTGPLSAPHTTAIRPTASQATLQH